MTQLELHAAPLKDLCAAPFVTCLQLCAAPVRVLCTAPLRTAAPFVTHLKLCIASLMALHIAHLREWCAAPLRVLQHPLLGTQPPCDTHKVTMKMQQYFLLAGQGNYHSIIVQLALPYCSAAYMMDILEHQVNEFRNEYEAMVREMHVHFSFLCLM